MRLPVTTIPPAEEACAYLVSRYPSVTHTFVLGEVRALRAAGVRVATASVRRVADTEVLSAVDREEQARTHALLPVSAAGLLRAHVRALRRGPVAFARTLVRALRMAHAGGRPRLWQAFYFAEAMLLWAWMEDEDLHHVHVHHANVSSDVALLACAFANAAGAPRRWTWSLTVHGPTELADVATHKLAAKVADAAAVLCVSDFARGQVLALARDEDAPKVRTVRCGIDVVAFSRSVAPPAPGRFEVLCVAALSRRKGHAVLLDAWPQVAAAERSVRLTLVGEGEERERLEAQVVALGLGGHVRFVGALGQDRIRALYDGAHAFCLPSFSEGVPIVLMEAMAMEVPVVATAVMGVGELVEHERSGLLVPAARADLLAGALLRLVDDEPLRERLGSAGRERVVRDFEIGRSAREVRAALRPFISQGAASV